MMKTILAALAIVALAAMFLATALQAYINFLLVG